MVSAFSRLFWDVNKIAWQKQHPGKLIKGSQGSLAPRSLQPATGSVRLALDEGPSLPGCVALETPQLLLGCPPGGRLGWRERPTHAHAAPVRYGASGSRAVAARSGRWRARARGRRAALSRDWPSRALAPAPQAPGSAAPARAVPGLAPGPGCGARGRPACYGPWAKRAPWDAAGPFPERRGGAGGVGSSSSSGVGSAGGPAAARARVPAAPPWA